MPGEPVVRLAVLAGLLVTLAGLAVGFGAWQAPPGPAGPTDGAGEPAGQCGDLCEFVRENPGAAYLYAVSTLGALWVAGRLARYWRVSFRRLALVPVCHARPADRVQSDAQPADRAPTAAQPADRAPTATQPADRAWSDARPADRAPTDDSPPERTGPREDA